MYVVHPMSCNYYVYTVHRTPLKQTPPGPKALKGCPLLRGCPFNVPPNFTVYMYSSELHFGPSSTW